MNDSIQRQEGILKEMTEVNGKFLGEKGGKDNGNARDDMLKVPFIYYVSTCIAQNII